MELQKRVKDHRDTYDLKLYEPIAINYFPVGHGIYIKDDKITLELLNDRSQGGTSLEDGHVELMINRRGYHDDHKGLGEPLNERQSDHWFSKGIPVTVNHYLRFYNNTVPKHGKLNSRYMQRLVDNPLIYIYGDFTYRKPSNSNLIYSENNEIDFGLPDEIKITIQPQYDGKTFIRLQNIMDLFSSTISYIVDVERIATKIGSMTSNKVKSVTEVSLTGIYTMQEMKKKKRWKALDFDTPDPDYSSNVNHVQLTPQRIRSFVIEFED